MCITFWNPVRHLGIHRFTFRKHRFLLWKILFSAVENIVFCRRKRIFGANEL